MPPAPRPAPPGNDRSFDHIRRANPELIADVHREIKKLLDDAASEGREDELRILERIDEEVGRELARLESDDDREDTTDADPPAVSPEDLAGGDAPGDGPLPDDLDLIPDDLIPDPLVPGPPGGGPGGFLPPPPGDGGGDDPGPGGFVPPPGDGGGGDPPVPPAPPWGPWLWPWWDHHDHCCCIHWPWLPPDEVFWICDDIFVCGIGGGCCVDVVVGPPTLCGIPLPIVEPIAEALIEVAYVGRIVLLNPAENGSTIQFLLSDDPFSLTAGYLQDFRLASTMIRFDRGGDFGRVRYSLRPGSYKFIVTERGWDLVKTSFDANLDNSANVGDFHLLLNDEPITIPARSTHKLRSGYPLTIAFDNGSSNPVHKSLADGETYTIGIDAGTGLWDIFPGDAAESGARRENAVVRIARRELTSDKEGETSSSARPIVP